MTYYEMIKSMSLEELAKFNAYKTFDVWTDYDGNEYPVDVHDDVYSTSDGSIFYFEDEAIEHEMEWLKSEVGCYG